MDTLEAARRGRDGDESAWATLTHKVREVVLDRLDRRALPPGYDSGDLVAIVLAEVWRSMGAFDPDAKGASFRGWVHTVRQRKLVDLWREVRAGKRGGGHVVHIESVVASAPETVDFPDPRWVSQSALFRSKELHASVDRALQSLDRKDLEVLAMREEQGLDFKRIAARLGYEREVSARSRYFRARERREEAVKACFADYELPRD